VFTVKADLLALLEEIGAPVASLQTAQGSASSWWHPGRSARLQLGPKAVLAEFGELHPAVLKALDVAGPVYGFEITLEAVPEPKKKAIKTKPAFTPLALMPLTRDFAFVADKAKAAGDLVKAAAGADKALIAAVRVFDVYEGPGVPDGSKSVALEVVVQPRDKTLAEAEIEALSAKIVAAVEKAAASCGGRRPSPLAPYESLRDRLPHTGKRPPERASSAPYGGGQTASSGQVGASVRRLGARRTKLAQARQTPRPCGTPCASSTPTLPV
jgi:phenylalanyl-tRNA synthetase beta chain